MEGGRMNFIVGIVWFWLKVILYLVAGCVLAVLVSILLILTTIVLAVGYFRIKHVFKLRWRGYLTHHWEQQMRGHWSTENSRLD